MLDQRPRSCTNLLERPMFDMPLDVDAALRELAGDLAGRLDRDEISPDNEALVAEAIDEAITAVLPVLLELLDRELTPRIEALPLATRLALVEARRRREIGFD